MDILGNMILLIYFQLIMIYNIRSTTIKSLLESMVSNIKIVTSSKALASLLKRKLSILMTLSEDDLYNDFKC